VKWCIAPFHITADPHRTIQRLATVMAVAALIAIYCSVLYWDARWPHPGSIGRYLESRLDSVARKCFISEWTSLEADITCKPPQYKTSAELPTRFRSIDFYFGSESYSACRAVIPRAFLLSHHHLLVISCWCCCRNGRTWEWRGILLASTISTFCAFLPTNSGSRTSSCTTSNNLRVANNCNDFDPVDLSVDLTDDLSANLIRWAGLTREAELF